MDRRECEKLIYKKIEEIREIYRQYNPEGTYISIQINDDAVDDGEYIQFNNRHWKGGKDENKPLNYSTFTRKLEEQEND